MITIREFLNKIFWSAEEQKSDYVLIYLDLGELKELPLEKVKTIEKYFMIVEKNGEATIPLHRIRAVKKKGEIVWRR